MYCHSPAQGAPATFLLSQVDISVVHTLRSNIPSEGERLVTVQGLSKRVGRQVQVLSRFTWASRVGAMLHLLAQCVLRGSSSHQAMQYAVLQAAEVACMQCHRPKQQVTAFSLAEQLMDRPSMKLTQAFPSTLNP